MNSEIPNLISIIARIIPDPKLSAILLEWENVIFALLAAVFLVLFLWLSSRKLEFVPSKTQVFIEFLVGGIYDFISEILGPKGKAAVPFLGTLFFYLVILNLLSIIPFFKSPTSSLPTTLALALCVFFYVHFTAIKANGIKGYLDHLMGRPRGILAFSVVIPIFILFLHIISEFIRPFSLSLRLRSNIWGDDVLLALIAQFGLKGVPLLLFNTLSTIIGVIVQALVFVLLSTIYLALAMPSEKETDIKKEG